MTKVGDKTNSQNTKQINFKENSVTHLEKQ